MTEQRLSQLKRLYEAGRLDPNDLLGEERLNSLTAPEIRALIEVIEAIYALECAELQCFRERIDAFLLQHKLEKNEEVWDILELLSEDTPRGQLEAEFLDMRRAIDNGTVSLREFLKLLEEDFTDDDAESPELAYQTVALLIRVGVERTEVLKRRLKEIAPSEDGETN